MSFALKSVCLALVLTCIFYTHECNASPADETANPTSQSASPATFYRWPIMPRDPSIPGLPDFSRPPQLLPPSSLPPRPVYPGTPVSYLLPSVYHCAPSPPLQMRPDWTGKIAVVTGASSGIGLATAKALYQKGMTVIGLARRKALMEEEMKKVKGSGKFVAIKCDLTVRKEIEDTFALIKTNYKTIHVLVNNAGTAKVGNIADLPFDDMKYIVDLNFMAYLLNAQLAIKMMKESGEESYIINMCSLAGHQVGPIAGSKSGTNVYSPTKFAIRALSLQLKEELKETKIRVANVSPGVVNTPLVQMYMKEDPAFKPAAMLETEDIADVIVNILSATTRTQIEEVIPVTRK